MSSVALSRELDLGRAPSSMPGNAPACAHRGIFRRILAAIERSQQRHAEQEAGRFIANHGARLTDDLERQLGEHFNGRGFPPYAPPRSFRPFAGL
jgi:hypothetical protein